MESEVLDDPVPFELTIFEGQPDLDGEAVEENLTNLTIPTVKELNTSDISTQTDELGEVKIKMKSEVLEEPTTFIWQPELDIKQDFEDDNSTSDLVQAELATEPVEQSETVQTDISLLTEVKNCKFSELVPPYNCQDDGFPRCPFKSLFFEEYMKHMKATHQVDGLSSFSSEDELLSKTIMEGWLVKEVGPFQCRYCKKATATLEEIQKHQAMFHVQKQCWFYYRKFVPNNTVTIPEQVNLEDPSFVIHVIHLPNQVRLYNFNLMDDPPSVTSTKLMDKTFVQFPPYLSVRDSEIEVEKSKKNSDVMLPIELMSKPVRVSADKKCKWEGCHRTYHSQMTLISHIESCHVKPQRGEKFTCFWLDCLRKSKPLDRRSELRIHIRFHTGEKPYSCHGCNKTFSHIGNLKAHRSRHMGENSYLCEFETCCKSFSKLSDKIIHQRMHINTKRHSCQVTGCPKEYKNQSGLWNHMKNHTIEERLEAKQKWGENNQKEGDFVSNKFFNSSNGVDLQETHYDTCEWKDCHQIYNSQSALVTHIGENHVRSQKGREFICFWINCTRNLKPFTAKQNLLVHMRVHSREKPYKCHFQGCNRCYSQFADLRKHQQRHTGETPHLCQFSTCYQRFSNLIDRDIHEKRTHYIRKTYAC